MSILLDLDIRSLWGCWNAERILTGESLHSYTLTLNVLAPRLRTAHHLEVIAVRLPIGFFQYKLETPNETLGR